MNTFFHYFYYPSKSYIWACYFLTLKCFSGSNCLLDQISVLQPDIQGLLIAEPSQLFQLQCLPFPAYSFLLKICQNTCHSSSRPYHLLPGADAEPPASLQCLFKLYTFSKIHYRITLTESLLQLYPRQVITKLL